MRTGFREIQRNFSNSAKDAGFRDFCGFRGIAGKRQPYPWCVGYRQQNLLPFRDELCQIWLHYVKRYEGRYRVGPKLAPSPFTGCSTPQLTGDGTNFGPPTCPIYQRPENLIEICALILELSYR